jgi:hypothetical protein
VIIPCSKERFDAFTLWVKDPIASAIALELEWFRDADDIVIGTLFLDSDTTYNYVVMGRDEIGQFRAIDFGIDYDDRDNARADLLAEMDAKVSSGERIFPQGVSDRVPLDFFIPVVESEKQHPYFKLFQSMKHWQCARGILSEMMKGYIDVDGNFVKDFQSTGFDARLWELYLHAYFKEECLYIERPKPAPDFLVSRGGNRAYIEAVTVGPTVGDPIPGPGVGLPNLRDSVETTTLTLDKIPIKFGSPLYSKLMKKYWIRPEVGKSPLVFAIADFHENQSMVWTGPGLWRYLYGLEQSYHHDNDGNLIVENKKVNHHQFEKKLIPSGFFYQPSAEHVSAVLFSSSGTMSKFNRMGRLAGFGTDVAMKMIRVAAYHDHNPNATKPIRRVEEVEPGKYTEDWSEGITMFHNPSALYPVDEDLFPSIAHVHLINGELQSRLPDRFPHQSFTMIFAGIDR